jgi:single-stranded DNA-specific DHH superfamily exonuclease
MKSKYLLRGPKDFHKFIDFLKPEDKIGIVTHIDLDGLASGIFLQKILESRNLKIEFIKFIEYGPNILKGIQGNANVLIFSDWNLDFFPKDFYELRKKAKVLVVDHHPLNENLKDKTGLIKTDSDYCSAHCLFDLAREGDYFDTKEWEWLVCGTIILDYCFMNENNFKFIKSIYPDTNKENIWSSQPGKIGETIANSLIYFKPDCKKVYDLLLEKNINYLKKYGKIISNEFEKWRDKFLDEAEYFEDKKLFYYFESPKYSITSAVISAISQQKFPKDTLVFVSNILEKKEFLKVSARNQIGEMKLGKVLKKCIDGFENASAGGHDKASAGSFPKKYLNEFKERLLRELGK